jgi:peptidoglycan/LPS O-acetylase OafA/YrhL
LSEIESRQERKYFRRDIQGLRGIAVLAVVVYHADLYLPGGFVGVDLFFVVSGFVVSRLILDEMEREGSFSLIYFFSRRIRRLIPVLTLVNIVSLLGTYLVLSPFGERQQTSATARSSAFFAANVNLLLDNSYISLVDNPFRHLWSLAVEEQFYLLFPFIFLLTLFVSKSNKSFSLAKTVATIFAVLSAVSFAAAIFSTRSTASERLQQFGFFGLPTRIWEFAVGVLAMLFARRFIIERTRRTDIAAAIGVIGIVWSFFALSESNGYPNLSSAIPVGSLFVIILCSVEGSPLRALLSSKLLVHFGDLSYGFYLWHWPLIVFAKRIWPEQSIAPLLSVVAAYALSIASLRLLENPVRFASAIFGRRAIALLVLCSAAVVLTASLVSANADHTQGRVESGEMKEADANRWGQGLALRDNFFSSVERCQSVDLPYVIDSLCSNGIEADGKSIMLLGDSHADAASDGLFAAGRLINKQVFGWNMPGCPLIEGYRVNSANFCESAGWFTQGAVKQYRPGVLVIVDSFVTYLTGEEPADSVSKELQEGVVTDVFKIEIRKIVDALATLVDGKKPFVGHIVIMQEVPFAVMPGTTGLGECPAHELLRHAVADEINSKYKDDPKVTIFDPSEYLFKDVDPCSAEGLADGLYWHKTHLNKAGSLKLVDGWKKVLSPLLK